uniref:Secreted protein n=1 Tax=Anguilla anguilla TaxID=7936 RepID=A0A0E9X6V6_ANGAN
MGWRCCSHLSFAVCKTAAWPFIKALSCVCVCYGERTGLNLVYCGPETAWCSKLIGAGAFQEVRLPIPHVIETLVTVIACYKHMGATESRERPLSFFPCACCLYINHNLHLFWIIIYYIIMMIILIVIVIVVFFWVFIV